MDEGLLTLHSQSQEVPACLGRLLQRIIISVLTMLVNPTQTRYLGPQFYVNFARRCFDNDSAVRRECHGRDKHGRLVK